MVEEFKKTFSDDTFGSDFEALVADSRYKYISKHYSSVLTKSEQRQKEKLSRSDKADKILTHKVWGIPIFLVILFLVFHLTFAEDFLFLGEGGVFDKKAVAYDVNKNVIEVTEDTYDPDNVKYYPTLAPKQRENAIAREKGAIFIAQIGKTLSDGTKHDGRAPDYDDWELNGDILVWYAPLQCAIELSSMGIRVDPTTLMRQLQAAHCTERARLPFHRKLRDDQLPQTIGGGIGQSRLFRDRRGRQLFLFAARGGRAADCRRDRRDSRAVRRSRR